MVDRLADSVAQQAQPSNGVHPDSGEHSSSGASASAAEPAVLLCGDFNAEPDSEELQVLIALSSRRWIDAASNYAEPQSIRNHRRDALFM